MIEPTEEEMKSMQREIVFRTTNNSAYEIAVGSPLLRPGMTITARVSERYAADTARRLMNLVREINL